MSILASELIGRVAIMGASKAISELEGVGKASDSADKKLDKLSKFGTLAAVGIGVTVAAIGVAAVKMAGDFQQSTNTLVTSAGLSRDAIGAVRQGILQMSVDTGTSTDQLVKGMFNVQSALHLGAGGLQVLKAAAEGAKAENSDLAQTTDVLTTAMVNYHLGAQQAVGTMNSLIVTVAAGKMHMNDLTGSLKNVLPVSASLKVKLSDVEGALATMANAGDRGTSAGTHLAMMFKMLTNPVGVAKKEMAAMGLNSIDLANTMRTSLPDALQMIQDAVAKHFVPGSVQFNDAVANILGGSKSGQAGLEIFNQGMKALQQNTDDAAAALRRGGKDVDNWAVIQSNLNFQLDSAHNALDVLLIQLGTKMLPILTSVVQHGVVPFVQGLTDIIEHGSPIITFFQGSSGGADLLKTALIGLAVAIAAVKITNLVSDMASFGAAVPGMLSKIYLVKAAESDSVTQMSLWGPTSANAARGVAASADAMKLSLAGVVTGVGLVLTAEIGLAKWIRDNNIVPVAGTKNQPDWITHLNASMKETVQIAGADKQAVQAYLDYVKQGGHDTFYAWSVDIYYMQQKYKAWLNYLVNGGTQAFDAWMSADNKRTDNFLKNSHNQQGQIEQTHRKLLELQGPVDMKVTDTSVVAAGNDAYQTWKKFQLLNGTSRWQAYLNTYQNTYIATIGGPGSGPGNARAAGGPITEPVIGVGLRTGQRWSFGENGPEMVVPFGGRTSHTSPQAQSSGASNQPIVLVMDGRVVARGLMPHITNQIRNATGVRF